MALGGAPFNVAWSLQAFGQSPLLVSAVGKDKLGQQILEQMQAWSLSQAGVHSHPSLPTGKVFVGFAKQNPNDPGYTIGDSHAWDHIQFPQGLQSQTDELAPTQAPQQPDQEDKEKKAEFLYHGTLALRSPENEALLQELTPLAQKRFYDVNLRPPHTPLARVKKWLHNATWVKLNLDELGQIVDQVGAELSFDAPHKALELLHEEYEIEQVLLTAGTQGALISSMQSGLSKLSPAPQAEAFVDAVGAGDAFSAMCLNGLMLGLSHEQIIHRAANFAAKVCTLSGATTQDHNFYS